MIELQPNEFIVSLDGDPQDYFKGKPLNIQLRNPHQAEYSVASLSMLKLLIAKINEAKPTKLEKPMPSITDIKSIIRKVKAMYIQNDDKGLDFNVELFKEVWSKAQK